MWHPLELLDEVLMKATENCQDLHEAAQSKVTAYSAIMKNYWKSRKPQKLTGIVNT